MPKLTRGQTRDMMRRLERDKERLEKLVEDQAQTIRKLEARIVEHSKCLPKTKYREDLQTDAGCDKV